MTLVIDQTIVNHSGDAYDWQQDQDPDVVVTRGTYLGGHKNGFSGSYQETLHNYGSIYGGFGGVSDGSVVNHGKIRSSGEGIYTAFTSFNYGTIDGQNAGVYLYEFSEYFLNRGTISGGRGIELEVAAGHIVNDGVVDGGSNGAISIDAMSDENCKIVNNGSLKGNVDLFSFYQATEGSLYVSNKGSIAGSIFFNNEGNGKAVYDGRQGTLSGQVDLEYGASVVYDGQGGSSVRTYGVGSDYVYCGAGADTIELDAGSSARHLTYISGFDPAADTIQLDHNIDTALTAGQTPNFEYSDTATSADDHLFLNASTNTLFYDADGNGSGKALALAHIAPGTRLTASDFKVI